VKIRPTGTKPLHAEKPDKQKDRHEEVNKPSSQFETVLV